MKNKHSAPTMKDVAQEAGVALGTVSKVFNGLPVGESYRRRVEDAARKLGYQVNHYARGLRSSQTRTVALILPSLIHPFFAALADGICHALNRRGYRLTLSLTDYDPDAEQECIRMVQQNKVDGIIGLTYNANLVIDESVPFVSIDRYFEANLACVSSDNYGGGQLAAEKLIELGCKKLLFFRLGSTVPGESDKRGAGFESVCRSRNVAYDSLYLNDEAGIEPFRAYLCAHIHGGVPDFDGIFCCTDPLACKVQKILAELGVRVPEDVQMIGFDGLRRHEDGLLSCSTIEQPVEQIAETAVEVLLTEDHSKYSALLCLPVRYLSGGTTRD